MSPQFGAAALIPGASSGTPGSSSHESSPPLTGRHTPVQAQKPTLLPIDTGLRRDGSDSSGSQHAPRHKSSVDRLRQDAAASSSRAASPISMGGHERNNSETGSSRGTSPHPSLYGAPASPGMRQSYTSSLAPGGSQTRTYSMQSLNSYLPRTGGAPHQRHVQVEMPRLLGARADSNGDFFPGMPRSHDSMHWNTVDGQMRQPPSTISENGKSTHWVRFRNRVDGRFRSPTRTSTVSVEIERQSKATVIIRSKWASGGMKSRWPRWLGKVDRRVGLET